MLQRTLLKMVDERVNGTIRFFLLIAQSSRHLPSSIDESLPFQSSFDFLLFNLILQNEKEIEDEMQVCTREAEEALYTNTSSVGSHQENKENQDGTELDGSEEQLETICF